MAKLIISGTVVEDHWTWLRLPVQDQPVKKQAGKVVELKLTGAESASAEVIAALEIPPGSVLVPLPVWLARRDELTPRLEQGEIGVWIDSHEAPEALAESVVDLNRIAVIAVHFPKFTDGRGYSIAHLLRSRYSYRRELRAVGDVLRDQLFYMKRCGFDAFQLRADKDIDAALASLGDFSEAYQGAADQPLPLFRRALGRIHI
jgi:uncharacterized protein (DUF934 family)